MSETLTFRTTTRWTRDRSGEVAAEGGPGPLAFSAPPEFHGQAGHWNPETLFVAAAGACYMTTLVALAEFSKLPLAGVEIAGETSVERVPGQGYHFTEVVLRPVVTLAREADREKIHKLLEKTEKNCLVTRALGNLVRVEPKIEFERVAKGA